MGNRIDLQKILEDILGSKHVYFQPPETVKMEYPCIVYHLISGTTQFADNNPYHFHKRYQILVIDRNPDSKILDRIATLPMCVFDRFYTTHNLNHYAFNMYY